MSRIALLTALLTTVVFSAQSGSYATGPFDPVTTVDGGRGSGSLRDAILQANAAGGATTIELAPGQTYQLTILDAGGDDDAAQRGDLDISASITILGHGATIEGKSGSRIFEVLPGAALALDDVTVTGGHGCVETFSGGEPGFDGGGIQNRGSLTLNQVTVSGNHACGAGGGIANLTFGPLTINASTISGNTADFKGGGIASNGNVVRITASTIADNRVPPFRAGAGGGGIYNLKVFSSASLTIEASTISGNQEGGLLNNGAATLTNVTVANNTSMAVSIAGGVGNAFSGLNPQLTLRNTILARNVNTADALRADCSQGFGRVISGGNNLRGGPSLCDSPNPWHASDIVGDPGLGNLGYFGGPTQTIRLTPASPAIDAGNNALFRGTDQRGVTQFDMHSDIGAFEYVPGATASFTPSDTAPLDAAPVTFTNTSSSTNGTFTSFWEFGDGTNSTDANPTHSFAAPDHPISYTARLYIVDALGSAAEASATIAAHPANEKPTAAFISDLTSAAVGQVVSFDASASHDPDGTITDHSWDWGDGTAPVTGVQVTHAWTTPDTFTVTLTVTDNGGRTATEIRTIFVQGKNFYADDDWKTGIALGADPPGPATKFGTDAFATITEALNAANAGVPGSIVHVMPGSYTEGFLSLSQNGGELLGAGRTVTHVTLSSLHVYGADVKIDGFDFIGSDRFTPVVVLTGPRATVKNNRIADGKYGVLIESDDHVIERNTIEKAAEHGILVAAGDSNILVDNAITNSGTGSAPGSEASGIAIASAQAATISRNTITGSAFAGVKLGGAVGTTIADNTITATHNAGGSAILLSPRTTNSSIARNQLGPNSGFGILQVDSAGASVGNVASQNVIAGNARGGVLNRDNGAPAAVFDARNNWWGDARGPSAGGPPLSTGTDPTSTGDSVSGNVIFTPILSSVPCNVVGTCSLRLVVTPQPGSAFAGELLAGQPWVEVEDSMGNLQTTSNVAAVTASIVPGTGRRGAILSGTTTVNVVGGVAKFTNLQIDRAGVGFKLVFTADGASAADSSAFNVTGSTVTGHVFATTPLVGAAVQVCRGRICTVTTTTTGGVYTASDISPGNDVFATAFPPSGASALAPKTIGPLIVPGAGGSTGSHDIILAGLTPPPPDTSIGPNRNPSGIPTVHNAASLVLTTRGCAAGAASYTMTFGGSVVRSGPLNEAPPGMYSANIAALSPLNGEAHITITLLCPGGPPVAIQFDAYIDPSGVVRRTDGTPIAGATVTLFRLDEASGTFVQVPDGDAIMSPSNRRNPDLSNGNGHFGWDTLAGFYKVRAEKAGCRAPGTTDTFVETDVIEVPPPKLDLLLVLDCPDNQTRTKVESSTNPSALAEDVTFTATVTSADSPLSAGSVVFSVDGLPLGSPVELDPGGEAHLTTSFSSAGTRLIQADYVPAAGYDASAESVVQVVEDVAADRIPPVTTASVSAGATLEGWNRANFGVTLTAQDEANGSGVRAIVYSASGAQTIDPTSAAGATANIGITAEGTTTIAFHAIDHAGNAEATTTITVRLDKTAPIVGCEPTPKMLWPPNHQLVDVALVVTVDDLLSGATGFTLTSLASNEPDNGRGDGNSAHDIQQFAIGTPDVTGRLRAERSGNGNGRRYTIGYVAMDAAGNSASCKAVVTVPHDRRSR
jgi:parallel beta-helix repeat protein